MYRAKVGEENEIEAKIPIIDKINFYLKMIRNMAGSKLKSDPPEFYVEGTLYQIKAAMSRGDYNVIMMMLSENFSEKGELEKKQVRLEKNSVNLPLKTRFSSGGGSRTSLTSGSGTAIRSAVMEVKRDPECKTLEFKFIFRGFQAELFSGKTDLSGVTSERNPGNSLAQVEISSLIVQGCVKHNENINAKATLQNMKLKDTRVLPEISSIHNSGGGINGNQLRNDYVMESKDSRERMVEVNYVKDAKSCEQDVQVRQKLSILILDFAMY